MNDNELFSLAQKYLQQGNFAECLEIIQSLEKRLPNTKELLYVKGIAYLRLGNHKQAMDIFDSLVTQHPTNVEYILLAGVVNENLNNLPEAERLYKQLLSIDSHNVSCLQNLASVYYKQSRFDESLDVLNTLEKIEGASYELLYIRASSLMGKYKLNDARAIFDALLEQNPRDYRVNSKYGILLQQLKLNTEAIEHLNRSLELMPTNEEALYGLGMVALSDEDESKALEYFNQSLAVNPNYLQAFAAIGTLYYHLANFETAIQWYNKALDIQGDYGLALYGISLCYYEMGRYDDDLMVINKALDSQPNESSYKFHKAELLLSAGAFKEGYTFYEKRLEFRIYNEVIYSGKLWNGEALPSDAVLLIIDEQGVGDYIMALRFVKALYAKNVRMIAQVRPSLLSLAKSLNYFEQTFKLNEPLPEKVFYTHYCFAASLQSFFIESENDLSHYPAPYIKPDDTISNKWKTTFSKSGKKAIGIIWAGAKNPKLARKRHMHPKYFAPLVSLNNVQLYSLQFGYGSDWLQETAFAEKVIDISTETKDFTEFIAAIAALDELVTVDTAAVHFAGAIGKSAIVLLPHQTEWRWMRGREYTPWYPQHKVLVQSVVGDWSSCMERVTPLFIERKIAYALSSGSFFGWGICSDYLTKESLQQQHIDIIDQNNTSLEYNGTVFHALTGVEFDTISAIRGTKNIGYTFFENELTNRSIENGKKLDLILAGSTWCKERLDEQGLTHNGVLIQGIDPTKFYPQNQPRVNNYFTIFSGGKFEYRKGQDLVLRATKVIMDRYKDVVLINAWYNMWEQSVRTMGASPHIHFDVNNFNHHEMMKKVYADNGLDENRILTIGLIDNSELNNLYSQTDIGVFPNRCEGGTNLVLMEYMACGKPVIASYTSGHTDIVNGKNALLLKDLQPLVIPNSAGGIFARWEEPSLDELIEQIDFAYNHREHLMELGKQGAFDLAQFTWQESAKQLLKYLNR